MSFAVTMAILAGRRVMARRPDIVGARMNFGSFIITSSVLVVRIDRRSCRQMPCTAGGRPVMIERLLGLVNVGTTQSASRFAPRRWTRANHGATPAATAASM